MAQEQNINIVLSGNTWVARIGISAIELHYKFLGFRDQGVRFVMKNMENLRQIYIFHYYLIEKGNISEAGQFKGLTWIECEM